MTIKFEQTAKDYIDFNFYYSWSRPEKMKTRIFCAAYPIIGFIAFKLIVYKSLDFYPDIYYFSVLFGLAYFMTPVQKWYNKIRINNLIKSGKNTDLTGFRTITFDSTKVIIQSQHSNSEINWSAFEKLGETKNHFFLFVTVNQAVLIPKRILNNNQEIDELRNLINLRMKPTIS